MLNKTLIALAVISSLSVALPAQAQGRDHGSQEARHQSSPKISVVFQGRTEHREYRHHGHHQNRHDYRHGRQYGHYQARHHGQHNGYQQGHQNGRQQDGRGSHR